MGMGSGWVVDGLLMGWRWIVDGLVMGWEWVRGGLGIGWGWVGDGLGMGWGRLQDWLGKLSKFKTSIIWETIPNPPDPPPPFRMGNFEKVGIFPLFLEAS